MMQRTIIVSEPDNYVLAIRAAKWLLERDYQKDAILAYGEGKQEVVFYVRRNKSSITVSQEPRR